MVNVCFLVFSRGGKANGLVFECECGLWKDNTLQLDLCTCFCTSWRPFSFFFISWFCRGKNKQLKKTLNVFNMCCFPWTHSASKEHALRNKTFLALMSVKKVLIKGYRKHDGHTNLGYTYCMWLSVLEKCVTKFRPDA